MDFSAIKDLYIGSTPVQSAWLNGSKVWGRKPAVDEQSIRDAIVLWYDLKKQGATNESMATTPTLIDHSGNGHDATCYNFAWTEESGISTTEYPGALVSDGVDDYCLVEGLPLLTKEQGYTVVAKRKYLAGIQQSCLASKRNSISQNGAFVFELQSVDWRRVDSFGYQNNIVQLEESDISYQTSKSYNEKAINVGEESDNNVLRLLNLRDNYFANVALYSFLLFNRDLTTEEIEWVKTNLIELDKSLVDAWIFSGLRNEDAPDSIVGEKGIELKCYNFAWNEEGSGFKDGAMWFDGVDDCLKVENIFKEPLTDFTIICRREILKYRQWSIFIRDTGTYPTSRSAFFFGYLDMPTYPVPNEGVNSFSSINILDIDTAERVSYMTPTNYNGMAISRGTINSECHDLTINPDGNVACKIKYFALYNKSLTEEQIQSEIEKLEKIWSNRLKR